MLNSSMNLTLNMKKQRNLFHSSEQPDRKMSLKKRWRGAWKHFRVLLILTVLKEGELPQSFHAELPCRNRREMKKTWISRITVHLVTDWYLFSSFLQFKFLLNSWMKFSHKFSKSFTWHQGPHLSKILYWPRDMRVSISL